MKTQLFQGDCLEVLKSIPDKSIDLIATDPPYKITPRGNYGTFGGMMKTEQSMKGKIFNENDISISDFIAEFYRVLKDSSHCYIMTNDKNLLEYMNEIAKADFIITKLLIWNKQNKICGQFYMTQKEYIIFCRKGKAKGINHCGTSDILEIPNKKTKSYGKNLHDTEKPVELMKVLVENSSNEQDTVLDPFMGIGSTGIACANTNRNFIGIELDENYFNIAKERIEKAQKKVEECEQFTLWQTEQ